jgi:rhamnosyltransferase
VFDRSARLQADNVAVQYGSFGMSVGAVIVTYDPSPERLELVLQSIRTDCDVAVIVDNGSPPHLVEVIKQIMKQEQRLIALGENLGIAAAQNIGLDVVKSLGVDRVLLLDQDSVPSPGLVCKLSAHVDTLLSEGAKVAAVGPSLVDGRWDSRTRLASRGRPSTNDALLEVDHLIASGSLVPLSAIDAVGKMRDELFIDYVDIEWGLRALRAGYRSYIALDTEMDHRLGTPMQVFGRTISTHSPMRHYYMVRNSIWLLRQPWLQPKWRYLKMPKIALHLFINAVFARPHREHRQMMTRGFRDGFSGRMGKGHE